MLRASRAMVRPGLLVVLLILLAPICLLLTLSGLHAGDNNSITVNNLTDPASTTGNHFCTLREAINNANAVADTSGGDCAAGTGNDTISFGVSGTITLGTNGALPAIVNDRTIDGSGQSITVDGANSFEVLSVNSGATLGLNSLTIAHGNTSGDGGGIENAGTLTVNNSTFANNSAEDGGGIINFGGTLTITESTFSSNSASDAGGGILNDGGTLIVTNSTFSGNTATSSGGGIYNSVGALTVTSRTFVDNS